jgi:hypothetical protein
MATNQNASETLRTSLLTANDGSDIKTVSGFSNDSFNLGYYNSDQRKRFTKFYGLSNGHFQRSTLPLALGVIESILNRYRTEEFNIGHQKNNWVMIFD